MTTTPLLGDIAPDFTAATTEGTLRFHDWIGCDWAMLFSHPKDFTPVCTTELGTLARLKPEFDRRRCRILALSVDSVEDHKRWARDIEESQGTAPNYPIVADIDLRIAKLYGMLPALAAGDASTRTALDNAPVRSVFIIGPDKRIKLMIVYPMSTGRDFREILRVLDSCQLTASHKVATPADWRPGEDVVILPSVSNDQEKQLFPDGWRAPKPYLRLVPQPRR
jgi:alkyl hydroperoxide reductase subunit AhpC